VHQEDTHTHLQSSWKGRRKQRTCQYHLHSSPTCMLTHLKVTCEKQDSGLAATPLGYKTPSKKPHHTTQCCFHSTLGAAALYKRHIHVTYLTRIRW